ncbi:MAG: hypothetical protein H7Y08_03645 [Rhizobiaceae bacterium]|nr:hypothetical protein [Rhizobiaceae bacterium]
MIETLGRWGLRLLSCIFVVAVARAAATLTWSLSGQTGTQVLDIATAFAEPRQDRAVETAPIIRLAPFGTAAAPVVVEAAKETSLGLVLHGVVVAAPEASIAVIASNAGRAEIYGVGDSVEGRATVLEVMNDKVMLRVGGSVESLSFPNPAQKPSGVANIVAGITNSGLPAVGAVPRSTQTPVLEEYRRRITHNPKSLLDSVGLSVSQDGYRVDQNATSTVLRAGLRPGDLISKVNGERVGDIERDRLLMDTIIASGQVRIEVMREGRPVFMSFPLK